MTFRGSFSNVGFSFSVPVQKKLTFSTSIDKSVCSQPYNCGPRFAQFKATLLRSSDLEHGEDEPVAENLKNINKTQEVQSKEKLGQVKDETKIIYAGMNQEEWTTDWLKRSFLNPPVYHASSIVFPTMESFRKASSDIPFTGLFYGRHGNPTTFAMEEAFSVIEGAYNACVTSSGVAAINVAILSSVRFGDHLLITDAAYKFSRTFSTNFLKRMGVTSTFFSPTITPSEFKILLEDHPNTTAVLLESPASLSFEVMDVAGIAQEAHKVGAAVIIDNTWGPTLFRPFDHGCDVSVNAATKYISGHSDLLMGIVAAKDEVMYRKVKKCVAEMGCPPGSDDVYLALRGLRTLGVRIRQHGLSGLIVAKWLDARPEVVRVMHPGLESHPQHALFEKQFSGSSGLFGFQIFDTFSQEAVDAMLDGMRLHSIALSWGGFESLLIQTHINSFRSADQWTYGNGFGFTFRIHVGLEDVEDLIKDLDDGFNRLQMVNAAKNPSHLN